VATLPPLSTPLFNYFFTMAQYGTDNSDISLAICKWGNVGKSLELCGSTEPAAEGSHCCSRLTSTSEAWPKSIFLTMNPLALLPA